MVDTKASETVNKFAVKGKTKVINGTITMPEGSGLRLILVPCSKSGKPDGALFDVLDKKWKAAKAELKGWYQHQTTYKLGAVKDVACQSDVWLMNCLFLDEKGTVDDKALLSCLKEVRKVALYERASVHCSSLVVEAVPHIQELLNKQLIEQGITVLFYQEPEAKL